MPLKTDHFRSTLNTWIDQELALGSVGRTRVNQHVMATYAEPLTIYFRGCSWRNLGEADDIINGFFADRLAREEFFSNWSASGLRLRRWLMNALMFYLKELRRRSRTIASIDDGEAINHPVTFDGDPDQAMDRAAGIAFVRRALEQTKEALQALGMQVHYELFLRHCIDGAAFGDLGADYHVEAARARVMARTAERHFRTALDEVLMQDGVPEDRIEEEVQSLLGVMGS